MDDDQDVTGIRSRLMALAEGPEGGVAGATELASGFNKVADHLDDAGGEVDAFVEHFEAAVSLLESEDGEESESDDATDGDDDDDEGLEQFVSSFRNDAEKRIQGLSISLMGIFGGVGTEEALEQSTDHLHAIRGGAAMLGLDDIAELATEMENTLLTNQELDPEERQWPTKPLLRGFALLEEGIEADPPAIDQEPLGEVLHALGGGSNQQRLANRSRQSTPVAESDYPDDVSRETEQSDPTARPSRSTAGAEQPILVVDDVEAIAASVGFILSELDVPVEVASDGTEALQMLEQQSFSLVISDIDMPRMDGITLTREIGDNDDLDDLPVILLTSIDDPEERQKGLDAGASDYIIKGSIGGGELLRRVRELLEDAPVIEAGEHTRTRRILIAEDTETVAASIAFVLSEGPFEIILATDGKDALRRLGDEPFDLLITDLQMPYMDGTELVRSVRSDTGLDDLPIIMLTSVEDEDAIEEASEAGVDRYMIKGEIAGGKLLTEVEELLESGESTP